MSDSQKTSRGGISKRLRTQFIAGILVVVPIGASILVLVWIFSAIDSILHPLVNAIWHRTIPGVGFATTLVLVYLVGVVATNVVGKRLIHYGESLLARVPVFRYLYTGVRQVLKGFATPDKTGFMQVVLVEFPRKGIRAIGFITNELTDKSGEKLLNVFIPTAPNPTTGFLQIMREEEVVRTGISAEDALRMVVSVGSMTPEGLGDQLPAQS